jgi:uncharacterized protein (DUF2164 family)
MTIKLSKENEERLLGSIQRFFSSEIDQDIGTLKSRLLLDFCLRELGPSIYNQAISDAQSHLHDRVTELDISCHEQEFSYWKK